MISTPRASWIPNGLRSTLQVGSIDLVVQSTLYRRADFATTNSSLPSALKLIP